MRLTLLLFLIAAGCSPAGPALAPLSAEARADLDPTLAAIYDAHLSGDDPAGAAPAVLVVGEDVFIEATAMSSGAALAEALGEVGMTAPSVAGVLVNGRLPIAAIPEAAGVTELRSIRPVYRPAQSPPDLDVERVGGDH